MASVIARIARTFSAAAASIAICAAAASARADADDPTVVVGASMGCGDFYGACTYGNVRLGVEAAGSPLRHLRLGGEAWYWERLDAPRGSSRGFDGFGPLVEAYTRLSSVEISARTECGFTVSAPVDRESPSGRWGGYVDVSVALRLFVHHFWIGPRGGVAAFWGQFDRLPFTKVITLGAGAAFG